MSEKPALSITVPATIDTGDFLRFAMFNTFRMRKAWRSPLIFALIFTVSAVVCFTAGRSREQAGLLGGVLLAVGILLPLVWYLMFVSSVKKEAKKHALSKTKAQYFTILREDGIKVVKEKEEAVFPWEEIYHAYRVKDCVYLYVTPQRAYLLPDGEEAEAVWETVCAKIPEEKRKDLR